MPGGADNEWLLKQIAYGVLIALNSGLLLHVAARKVGAGKALYFTIALQINPTHFKFFKPRST